jgi:penicillin-binding protein 1B
LRLHDKMPGQAQLTTVSSEKAKHSAPRWRRIGKVIARRVRRRLNSRYVLLLAITPALAALFVVAGFYLHFSREIDQQLRQDPFEDSTSIFASPLIVSVNDPTGAEQLQSELNLAGYRQDSSGRPGTWRSSDGQNIALVPFEGSSEPRVSISINQGVIASIRTPAGQVGHFDLGNPLLTTLNASREKRRLVKFSQIPPDLVHAIISAEDKHFFQHGGLDLPRVAKAAWVDFRYDRKAQGASTLTMQLVRGLWLEPDKRWKRKIAEALMTVHLEHKWTKQRIFETYVNQVFLGRQAAYNIRGFGEASRVFLGKPLRDVTLPESALLAGMVQRPTYFNPFRYPQRAKERRDLVLSLMRENHYISESQYADAVATPIDLGSPRQSDTSAPYFLDLVNEELQNRESQPARALYTTIDINLQRAADAAVASGMKGVDKLLARKEKDGARPEAALIALDPHTGEIKALVGGRDYARSQLNRILARRPPGSVFKPFVYAAALNTALAGGDEVLTPASTVDDQPTTFWFNGQAYEPANFKHEVFGVLTLRDALAKSDNVAAVQVAQTVGFRTVAALAKRCGLNGNIQATPAIALGAYDATPLEIAGAYTVFANGGIRQQPTLISRIESARSDASAAQSTPGPAGPGSYQALDPRVAWLMENMLEEVMRSGTAAGVRAHGFALPAAGKTGTSHDGWFAGFTSQLLCVVWVGFDDYRELGLEGAKSALPIWTEFMKQASRFGPYRNARKFPQPAGIESTRICTESGKLEGDFCDETRTEYFIDGTAPTEKCDLHSFPARQQTASDGFDPNSPDAQSSAPSALGNSDPQQQ